MKTGTIRSLSIAVGALLALDGAVLLYAGLRFGRASVTVLGAALLVAPAGLFLAWRRHVRQVAEIATARQDLKHEVESMRDALRGG